MHFSFPSTRATYRMLSRHSWFIRPDNPIQKSVIAMLYDMVPLFQEIVLEAIPYQNCHMNMRSILNGFCCKFKNGFRITTLYMIWGLDSNRIRWSLIWPLGLSMWNWCPTFQRLSLHLQGLIWTALCSDAIFMHIAFLSSRTSSFQNIMVLEERTGIWSLGPETKNAFC
jgi:hypothetical protein